MFRNDEERKNILKQKETTKNVLKSLGVPTATEAVAVKPKEFNQYKGQHFKRGMIINTEKEEMHVIKHDLLKGTLKLHGCTQEYKRGTKFNFNGIEFISIRCNTIDTILVLKDVRKL